MARNPQHLLRQLGAGAVGVVLVVLIVANNVGQVTALWDRVFRQSPSVGHPPSVAQMWQAEWDKTSGQDRSTFCSAYVGDPAALTRSMNHQAFTVTQADATTFLTSHC